MWFYVKPQHTKQAGSDWAGLLDQLQPDTCHATTPQHLHLLRKPHHVLVKVSIRVSNPTLFKPSSAQMRCLLKTRTAG